MMSWLDKNKIGKYKNKYSENPINTFIMSYIYRNGPPFQNDPFLNTPRGNHIRVKNCAYESEKFWENEIIEDALFGLSAL